jgi:exodeoxyribonuclease VII small subunit
MKKDVSYSKAIKEIEAIVTEIEDESIDVDLLTDKVKTALGLIKLCKGKLKSTEEELNAVINDFTDNKASEKIKEDDNKKITQSQIAFDL